MGSGHGAVGSWSYHEVGEGEVVQRILQAAPLLLRVPAAIGEAKTADGLFQPCNGVVVVTCVIGHLRGSAGSAQSCCWVTLAFFLSYPFPSPSKLILFQPFPSSLQLIPSHPNSHSSSHTQSHRHPYPYSILSSLLSPFCPIPSFPFSSQSISLFLHHVFISSPSHLHLRPHPLSYI